MYIPSLRDIAVSGERIPKSAPTLRRPDSAGFGLKEAGRTALGKCHKVETP